MPPQAKIPLFPLEVVLLPETILPLHIFEERYKIMIGECLAEDREFGVVCVESDGIKRMGCTARIERVLKSYEDGRMDIVTRGGKRFVIHRTYDDRPYLQASVTYFDDEAEDKSEDIDELISKGIELMNQFHYMTGKREDYTPLLEFDHKTISFWISNSTGFTVAEKQKFLEMTSTTDRLKQSVSLLEKVVDRMKVTREIERVIGGNGNLRKLDA
jgi:Lon protease-like protein